MPELPDITVYIEALEARILHRKLERALIAGPSLLRTADVAVAELEGREVTQLRRIGKRIGIGLGTGGDTEAWMVLHLMIAGRLHWSAKPKKPDGRRTLAAFEFDSGCLTLTEAGSRKRASLHIVRGAAEALALDRGGIDPMTATLDDFVRVIGSENHTLKRTLTDPRLLSGIGNAYSDEILHRARMSPVKLTSRMTRQDAAELLQAIRDTIEEWIGRLRSQAGGKFPEHVTAFHEEMAVHGRFGQPCPRCGAKVQRIRHADNETNYCAVCQTGGKLLADRALSRLLRQDWPRTLEELEEQKAARLVIP